MSALRVIIGVTIALTGYVALPTMAFGQEIEAVTVAPGQAVQIAEGDWSSIETEIPESEVSSPQGGIQMKQAYGNNPAPACINAVVEHGFIQVYNNCGFHVRVKVVRAFAPDTACSLVVDGTRHNIGANMGRIDRVELC